MNGSQDNPATPPVEPAAQAPPAPQVPPTAAAGNFLQMAPGVAQDPRAKSPALACFLSLMPGLGQVYTGYYVRGFVHIVTVAGIITLLASGDMDGLAPFLGLFLAFFWLHNCIDAARRATFYNQMLAGGTELDPLTPEMKIPGSSGSIFAGLGLIVAGIIALSYTKYDMSLAWLEDWWPLVPILIGIYLVGMAALDRMKDRNP